MKVNNPGVRANGGGSKHTPRSLLGFTLVELIVVITILVILGTIAFVSLGGYSESARDGVRTSNASALMKGLDVSYIRTGSYPLPDTSSINILSGSTLIGYQGYVGSGIILRSKVSGDLSDPVDKTPFVYSVNVSQKKAQLLGFFESSTSIALQTPLPIAEQTTAATPDYSKRYPFVKGQSLGIILSNTGSTKNQPIQDVLTGSVDVGSGTVNAILSAYVSSGVLVGTWVSGVIPAYVWSGSSTSGWAGTATIDFTNAGDYSLQSAMNLSVSGGSVSLKPIMGYTSDLVPTMTSNTAPSGQIIADFNDPGWSYCDPWYLFNGVYEPGPQDCNSPGRWNSNKQPTSGSPVYVEYDFPGGTTKQITRYTMQAVQWSGEDPKTWKFQAHNGSSWIDLDTQTNAPIWWNGEKRIYAFVNTNTYQKYRWSFTESYTSGGGNNWGDITIDELEMMEDSPTSSYTTANTYSSDITTGMTASASSSIDCSGTPSSTIDNVTGVSTGCGSGTKWRGTWGVGAWLQIDFGAGNDRHIRRVRFVTRTDYGAGWYTPTQEKVQYSTNGSTWNDAATINPSDVNTWQQFDIPASQSARYWRLYMDSSNATEWIIEELEMMELSPAAYALTSSTAQLSTTSWTALTSVTPTETLSSQATYYALSFDGRMTWKSWDGSAWRTIVRNNAGTWQYNGSATSTPSWTNCTTNAQEACISQSFSTTQNRMIGTTLAGLSQSSLQSTGGFVPWSTSTIDLAVGLSTSSASVTPSVDKLSFGYTQ